MMVSVPWYVVLGVTSAGSWLMFRAAQRLARRILLEVARGELGHLELDTDLAKHAEVLVDEAQEFQERPLLFCSPYFTKMR